MSPKTVRNDLEKTTVEGVPSEPANGAVIGKDKRVQPAKKPLPRCERCKRIKKPESECEVCLQCLQLRGKPKSTPKPPHFDDPSDNEPAPKRGKSGSPSANVSESYRARFEKLYDAMILLIGQRRVVMGSDKNHTACIANLFQCRKDFIAWESA